jgi:hypothetical protein
VFQWRVVLPSLERLGEERRELTAVPVELGVTAPILLGESPASLKMPTRSVELHRCFDPIFECAFLFSLALQSTRPIRRTHAI